MKQTVFLNALLFIPLAMAGCGGGTVDSVSENEAPPAATAERQSLVDPCSLLTQEEASQVLGTEAGAPQLQETSNIMGIRICQWEPANEAEMGLIQVSILQTEGIGMVLRGRGMTAEKIFSETKTQMSPEPVAGIGDEAYWTGSDLTVLKNGVQVSVSAGSSAIVKAGEQGLPAAKKVAARVVPRL